MARSLKFSMFFACFSKVVRQNAIIRDHRAQLRSLRKSAKIPCSDKYPARIVAGDSSIGVQLWRCTFQQSRTRGELGGRCKTLMMAQLRHVMVIAGFSKVTGRGNAGPVTGLRSRNASPAA
jgi:hypothetical protein